MISTVEEILRLKIKPKEKQNVLVEAVASGAIPVEQFIDFFVSAKPTDMGACADALKHLSERCPQLLGVYISTLIVYINHPVPRVKWGIPEAIGNLARVYPQEASQAIPYLLQNTVADEKNTTVIRWCAAYALGEIARYSHSARQQLLPLFEELIQRESNNGVRNVYIKALKAISLSAPSAQPANPS